MKRTGQVVRTLLVLLFVSSLTLTSAQRTPGKEAAAFLCMMGCGNEGMRDILSNILLFIPLGWVLRYWTTPRVALILCLLATIGIETTQALVLTGRDPSLRDIVTNTGGGWIGITLFAHWSTLLSPSRTLAARIGAVAMAGWISVVLVTAAGLRPSPTAVPWWGQWQPELGQYEVYPGQLLDVTVDGWKAPGTRLDEPQPIRTGFERDSLDVIVVTISGERRVTRPAPIFSVFDSLQKEQLLIGQKRGDLVLQSRTAFDRWELRGLSMRLPYFPGREPGDTVTIRAQIHPGAWVLTAQSADSTKQSILPLTAGLGWATMIFFPYTIYNEWLVLNGLWLGVLIAPAGYWLTHSASPRVLLGGFATAGATLLLAPLLFGIGVTLPNEWWGTAAGLLLGAGVALLVRRRRRSS
jgi:hypothetical protein